MKKLFLIPAFILLISTGVTSNSPHKETILQSIKSVPINTSLDSVNVRMLELNNLIQQ